MPCEPIRACKRKVVGCSVEDDNKRLMAENKRLRAEVAALHLRLERVTGGVRLPEMPIAVKKALNLAGYWNVHPNDVLVIAPVLAEEFERETSICPLQHNGTSVCFPSPERDRVIRLVARLMPQVLPKYRRNV